MNDFTLLKVFGTGQVTIPKAWREKLASDKFIATIRENTIVLEPAETATNKTNIKDLRGALKGIDTEIVREKDRL